MPREHEWRDDEKDRGKNWHIFVMVDLHCVMVCSMSDGPSLCPFYTFVRLFVCLSVCLSVDTSYQPIFLTSV